MLNQNFSKQEPLQQREDDWFKIGPGCGRNESVCIKSYQRDCVLALIPRPEADHQEFIGQEENTASS